MQTPRTQEGRYARRLNTSLISLRPVRHFEGLVRRLFTLGCVLRKKQLRAAVAGHGAPTLTRSMSYTMARLSSR
jgi:hypothetical protein